MTSDNGRFPAAFRREGHFVLPDALGSGELAALRAACDSLMAEKIDDGGGDRHRIGLGSARRFLAHRHAEFPDVERVILGGKPAQVAAVLLGGDARLFNEQFVVKGPGAGAGFAWHQDGAYVGFPHAPYVTVWIALDDATEENGCVRLLPRDLDESPGLRSHEWLEETRELNGYDGGDPGRAMTCRAGDAVVFSSLTLHRSGPNATARPRRAYVVQYSDAPLRDPQTGALKRFAKPLAVPAAG